MHVLILVLIGLVMCFGPSYGALFSVFGRSPPKELKQEILNYIKNGYCKYGDMLFGSSSTIAFISTTDTGTPTHRYYIRLSNHKKYTFPIWSEESKAIAKKFKESRKPLDIRRET
jgi:hypothetical protein